MEKKQQEQILQFEASKAIWIITMLHIQQLAVSDLYNYC